MYPPSAVSNISPRPECRQKTDKLGTNGECNRWAADPETEMGEVEAEE